VVAIMAKKGLPARKDDDATTTVKAYRRLARAISQLAALRDENQQDVLQRYAKIIEDDLSSVLATRQRELKGNPAETR
jgi:hypothetical protein